jgi:large subunit ribosomal protein L15
VIAEEEVFDMSKTIKIKYVHSPIGREKRQKDTVRCLGLKKLGQVKEVSDSDSIRGMLKKIPHLVEVLVMSILNDLKAPKGATKKKKRVGRGESSGWGKTSGRGHKGQKARSGGYHKVGFEGGQIPFIRRIPKRGFTSIFKKDYAILNVSDLEKLPAELKEIDYDTLVKAKVIRQKAPNGLKILGNGELKRSIQVKAAKFTASAKEKIEKAGGQAIQA